eukprot:1038914-Prorocentrum_lima.AAC.1
MATVPDQRITLPFSVYVAVRLDKNNSGRSSPARDIFVGRGTPTFHLIAKLVTDQLNGGACLGR